MYSQTRVSLKGFKSQKIENKMDYFSTLTFDNGTITPREYLYLVEFVRQNCFKSVLEFGPGLSTYAFLENNCEVYTFEHDPKWFKVYSREFARFGNVHVCQYEVKDETLYLPQIEGKSFDMAFVDAPLGGRDLSRLKTCEAASKHTAVFILHDCRRADERAILNIFERMGWKTEIVAIGRGLGICHRKDVTVQSTVFHGPGGALEEKRSVRARQSSAGPHQTKSGKVNMANYAIFVCADGEYLKFLNVLLNSLDKQDICMDTYLLHYGFPKKYIVDAQKAFRYPIIPIEITKDNFDIHEHNRADKNLFVKQARFKYIREYGLKYDAICMLDADMFIVSHNFVNLFKLIEGTSYLIGCNERFKWTFTRNYVTRGQPIFERPVRAHKFHCCVPIILDLRQWADVFDTYNSLAYNSFEIDDSGNIVKPIGDLFCWNISVYANNRQDDVILFPMETMTQVHHTYANPWTRLSKNDGHWWTFAGDEVFSIHGRIGNKDWFDEQMRGVTKLFAEHQMTFAEDTQERVREALRAIQKEWYSLNCNHKLSVYEYCPRDAYWESFR